MNIYLESVGDSFTIFPSICNSGPYDCGGAALSITIPSGISFVSADTSGKGSFDPLSNTWQVGKIEANEDGSRCHSISLSLRLDDDSSLPLTIQANGTSDCVEDTSDNVVSWVLNTLENVPGGTSDVTIDLSTTSSYLLQAGGLIDYIVYTPLDTSTFMIGTVPGGSDLFSMVMTNTAIKTLQLGYYTPTEQLIYFTGTGKVDIFLQ